MSNPTFADQIQAAFAPSESGIVGVADQLLKLCATHGLRMSWQDNACTIELLEAEPPESLQIPLRKPLFRAILARFATLCNEQAPDSVSPYGGEAKLILQKTPLVVADLTFANQPDAQWLELAPEQSEAIRGNLSQIREE